ncbi:hypothetical protein FHX42_001691 [Saccharopolyspora lacisalsi]|uniref:S-adenosyl methyltransferase n=1 Tax=Halosaccharopolyspora lacisalsi TaxID=1000566 RepID=A0A839DS57_9PSEU|nr:SAM-dependent methyltransferase [Halosaccharopolyspora lacisalsi]MBA8824344.1 hypothetical protein [Halosaccharopolyspora lacisalsi]
MPRSHQDNPASDHVDIDSPNAARMYDYYLGGSANFAVDRQAADQVIASMPDAVLTMQANRSFLGRVVNYCCERGISQFLDLGSGVPTVGNVHEIAHRHDPTARVAYVDNEAVAVAHSRNLLHTEPHVTIARADLRDPEAVLTAPGVAGLLDFNQPICLLMISVLNFVPDDEVPAALVRRYTSALASGSYVGLSHVTADKLDADTAQHVRELYANTNPPSRWRTRSEISAFLNGFEQVEPGLVTPTLWRPDPHDDTDPGRIACWAALARVN